MSYECECTEHCYCYGMSNERIRIDSENSIHVVRVYIDRLESEYSWRRYIMPYGVRYLSATDAHTESVFVEDPEDLENGGSFEDWRYVDVTFQGPRFIRTVYDIDYPGDISSQPTLISNVYVSVSENCIVPPSRAIPIETAVRGMSHSQALNVLVLPGLASISLVANHHNAIDLTCFEEIEPAGIFPNQPG